MSIFRIASLKHLQHLGTLVHCGWECKLVQLLWKTDKISTKAGGVCIPHNTSKL